MQPSSWATLQAQSQQAPATTTPQEPVNPYATKTDPNAPLTFNQATQMGMNGQAPSLNQVINTSMPSKANSYGMNPPLSPIKIF